MSNLIEKQASLLAAMANAKRLEVLLLIIENEWKVNELAAQVKLSQSALSQHLSKLRGEGLVTTRRDAQTVYYSCKADPVKKILDALQTVYLAEKPTGKEAA